MYDSICAMVRKAEENYLNGTVLMSKYVNWDMHDTIETIDAYLNSKHTSGPTDSLGRDKPFFNIVTAATNVWYRATDIDRKDIRVMPDSSEDTAAAFIATVILRNWMKEAKFGVFLNDWGRALARYGSAVVKFVEKDGTLTASVIPWNRMIVDPIDFSALPRIEKFYKTPAQLRRMEEYDQDVVEKLIESHTTRKTLDKHQQDNMSDFIELYEVHGELPTYLLDDKQPNPDDTIVYRQQMQVISFVSAGRDEYDDFVLFRGKEAKDPYMLTHLIKEDGRTLSIGAVEHLFEAQWMTNHSMKNMKDTLDIASKLIFQTADKSYIGRNVLSAIETGDIMIHDTNMPLTQVNNSKPDITAFQNFGVAWQNLGQEITSTPDATRGTTPPSGIALGTVQIVTSQGLSLFEIMTENKGLHIEEMMREYVIPHIKKKMDTKDEIVAILDANEISQIEGIYIKNTVTKKANAQMVNDVITALENDSELPTQEGYDSMMQAETQSMQEQFSSIIGGQRFFKPSELDDKTWKDVTENLEWKLNVEVTNEQTDKQAVLQTLNMLLQTIASNPAILQDPNAKMLFTTILTETGRISPIQLSTATTSMAPNTPSTGGAEALSVGTK